MLKKTLIILTSIILVCAMLFAVGCSLFPVNQEREQAQVVYTVYHDGLSTPVTKAELDTYFSQYGQFYYQQYGMSVEEIMDYFSRILIKRKVSMLEAKSYFSKLQGKDGNKVAAIDLLRPDEQKFVVESTNDQFNELFEAELKKIRSGNKDEEQEEETVDLPESLKLDDKAVGNIRPKEQDAKKEKKYVKDESITSYDVKANYWEAITLIDTKEKKSAYNQLKSELDKNFKTYEYFLNLEAENRMINKYREENPLFDVAAPSEEEIQARYDKMIKEHIVQYVKGQGYDNAVKSGTVLLAQPYPGTGMIKSVLFKFSDMQKAKLDEAKMLYGEDIKGYKEFRQKLATEYTTLENGIEGGIKVKLSNDKYDASKPMSVDNYPYELNEEKTEIKYYNYDEVLSKINDDINELGAEATLQDKIKVFNKWIYLANDDPGMFNNKDGGYTLPIDGDSSYVKEYTDLGRALLAKGVGAYQVDSTGTEETLFTTTNGITFIVNDFGIHFIVVVNDGINVSDPAVTKYSEDGTIITDGTPKYYVCGREYVLSGNKEYETVNDYVIDLLKKEKRNALVDKNEIEIFNKAFAAKKVNKRLVKSISSKFEKVLKSRQ